MSFFAIILGVMSTSNSSTISKLDAVAFDALLRTQDPFGASNPRFDLRGVKFITPSAMVQLAAACHALDQEGRRATISLHGLEVPSYLLRSNFVKVVQSVARFDPPYKANLLDTFDHLQGSKSVLVEVTKIETGRALQKLLPRIVDGLIVQLGYPENAAFDVATAVSEISQNTFDHNDETCGFLAMQVYRQASTPFLEIGVADYGDGLATTLRRNQAYAYLTTDWEAIEHAIQNRTSQYDDKTRGTGLHHLMRIASTHSGSVQIRSGNASLRYRADKQTGRRIAVPPMPGVHIALTLPALLTAT